MGAFNNGICVGSRQWDVDNCGGGVCDVPAMGDDDSEYTIGYMQPGQIPTFKIYDASSGIYYDALTQAEVDLWSLNEFSMNDLLEANWSINPSGFQYNGSITSGVYIDNISIVSENDMLAAFVDGEIRGVANGLQSPFENIVFPIMVYSNNSSGETLEFIYYDSSLNLYHQLNETIEFISDMTIGNAISPFIFTFGDIIYGCTNTDACNYDQNANTDDGSCLEFDCAGVCPSSADYEEAYWDNNGGCCTDSERDECGICDGDGSSCAGATPGCTDSAACNYDSDATFDNGFCVLPLDYCADIDGDGLGAGDTISYCLADLPSDGSFVEDCSDSYPDCATNDVGECGSCGCLSIEESISESFKISNIYPNPFNPILNINLSIGMAGHLSLSVYNIKGTQVKTIYNGFSSIGELTFAWTPKNRASGFYIINAILADQVITQKVLLMK